MAMTFNLYANFLTNYSGFMGKCSEMALLISLADTFNFSPFSYIVFWSIHILWLKINIFVYIKWDLKKLISVEEFLTVYCCHFGNRRIWKYDRVCRELLLQCNNVIELIVFYRIFWPSRDINLWDCNKKKKSRKRRSPCLGQQHRDMELFLQMKHVAFWIKGCHF